ncbi:MAG: hypothetical protein IPQ27_12800 [Chitinophagaceae bacterium]|nr:hypothetical protein [Chitinophagaceae bacterium]
MRIEINLDEKTIAAMEAKAKLQNNSRKAYIEFLCQADAILYWSQNKYVKKPAKNKTGKHDG